MFISPQGMAEVFDLRDGQRIQTFGESASGPASESRETELGSLEDAGGAFSQDGRWIVACPVGPDRKCRVFDRRNPSWSRSLSGEFIGPEEHGRGPRPWFGFSPRGTYVFQLDYDGVEDESYVTVARSETGKTLPAWSGPWEAFGWDQEERSLYVARRSSSLVEVLPRGGKADSDKGALRPGRAHASTGCSGTSGT